MRPLSIILALHRFDPHLYRATAAFCVAGMILTACAPQERSGPPTAAPTAALPTARPTTTPRPTPTIVPVTPPPPREGVITPTPIIYVVQANDTLIPIANKFGVSVADIIAANGNLNPATLQIGQRLVIPTGATNPSASNASAQQLLPSPTPLPYELRGVNCVRTAAGSLECLGEVFNNSGSALTNVQILLTLLDSPGTPLQAQTVFVARDVVPNGETSPFRVLFTAPPATYANVTVIALRGERATLDAYASLRVDQPAGSPNGSQFNVSGAVANIGTSNANTVRLLVTAYDTDRRVIGYRFVDLSATPLSPQASIPFSASIVTASRDVAAYGVLAEGLASQP